MKRVAKKPQHKYKRRLKEIGELKGREEGGRGAGDTKRKSRDQWYLLAGGYGGLETGGSCYANLDKKEKKEKEVGGDQWAEVWGNDLQWP